MNEVFQKLITNNTLAVSFLTWYNKHYKDITIFQNAPFEQQLGVFLKYFEENKAITLSATTRGYVVFYLTDTISIDKLANRDGYFFEKFECPPDTVMNNFARGIIWMIANNELPF